MDHTNLLKQIELNLRSHETNDFEQLKFKVRVIYDLVSAAIQEEEKQSKKKRREINGSTNN